MSTTYVSLAASPSMFPPGHSIETSVLTPDLIRRRLESGLPIRSILSHPTTIDALERRYGLTLPPGEIGPDGRPIRITLSPGDEVFILLAELPRLREGEIHSQQVIEAAPVQLLRWRVPLGFQAYEQSALIPQYFYDLVIDRAHASCLWEGRDGLHPADMYRQHVAQASASLKANSSVRLALHPNREEEWHELVKEELILSSELLEASILLAHVTGSMVTSGLRLIQQAAHIPKACDALAILSARRAAGHRDDNEAKKELIRNLYASLRDEEEDE